MSRKLFRKILVTCTVLTLLICINVQAASCVIYSVKKGDSLWKISQNFQVSLADVILYNPQIENPDLIYPEDQVYVPVDIVDIDSPSEDTDDGTAPDDNDNSTVPPSTPGDNNVDDSNTNGNNTDDNADDDPSDLSDLEADVLRLVNEERASQGLTALTINTEVTNAARIKAKDMIDNKYFDHVSPVYGSPSEMLTSFGISHKASGENIAWGQRTGVEVMNSWMNSSGHRANILSKTYTEIGIGCVSMENGTLYWTQIFIKP